MFDYLTEIQTVSRPRWQWWGLYLYWGLITGAVITTAIAHLI